MGKKKQSKPREEDRGPAEDTAMEAMDAPEVIVVDAPVSEKAENSVSAEAGVAKGVAGNGSGEEMLSDTADITEQMTQLERETHELKETLLRKMAEFENLKKRTAREKEEAVRYGTAAVLTRLLEVLDNFDRALLLDPDSEGFDIHSFYEGMKLISKHLLDILRGEGLIEIDPKGEPFDPFFHEAMMREESADLPDNMVIEVFQKGYKLKDRLLRPARVKVSVRPKAAPVEEDAADSAEPAGEESES
ncbi:MAG: nucleotide exchange factor GrpE [Acidobacteria bacterium]|nr:nucleotide exchange factor GrpE [Acidobacteriota bacterium]